MATASLKPPNTLGGIPALKAIVFKADKANVRRSSASAYVSRS